METEIVFCGVETEFLSRA